MAKVNGIGLAAAGFGGLFLYAAITGKSIASALRGLAQGKSPASASSSNMPIIDPANLPGNISSGSDLLPPGDMRRASSGSPSANAKIGQVLAARVGWTGQQWAALNQLVQDESGWNNNAQNPTSTAYGIGQFLDTTWSDFGPKTSNPTLQIAYMLEYIKERYGNPANALAHENAYHWY